MWQMRPNSGQQNQHTIKDFFQTFSDLLMNRRLLFSYDWCFGCLIGSTIKNPLTLICTNLLIILHTCRSVHVFVHPFTHLQLLFNTNSSIVFKLWQQVWDLWRILVLCILCQVKWFFTSTKQKNISYVIRNVLFWPKVLIMCFAVIGPHSYLQCENS